jgi:hypothetical protein
VDRRPEGWSRRQRMILHDLGQGSWTRCHDSFLLCACGLQPKRAFPAWGKERPKLSGGWANDRETTAKNSVSRLLEE